MRMTISKHQLNATTYGLILLAVTLPLVSIAVSQIFLALSILSFVLEWCWAKRERIVFPPICLPLVLFMFATLAALIFSPEPGIGRAQINKFWLFVIIILVVNRFDGTRVVQAYHLLFLLGVLASMMVIAQFIVTMQVNVETRLTGFMGNWMTLSGELMLASVAGAGYALFSKPRKVWLWIAGFGVMTVGLLLTLTRSVWIATLVGVLLLLLMKHFRWRTLAAAGVAVTLLVAAAPGVIQKRIRSVWDPQDPSNYARLAIWKAGLRMVADRPWTGVGPQRIPRVFYEYHPKPEDRQRSGFYPVHMHNNLLQFAAERGVPCAVLWLWLMGRLAWDHWRGFRMSKEGEIGRTVSAIGFAAIVVLFLAGLFEFNFADSEVLMIFLFLISAPYALRASQQPCQPRPAA